MGPLQLAVHPRYDWGELKNTYNGLKDEDHCSSLQTSKWKATILMNRTKVPDAVFHTKGSIEIEPPCNEKNIVSDMYLHDLEHASLIRFIEVREFPSNDPIHDDASNQGSEYLLDQSSTEYRIPKSIKDIDINIDLGTERAVRGLHLSLIGSPTSITGSIHVGLKPDDKCPLEASYCMPDSYSESSEDGWVWFDLGKASAARYVNTCSVIIILSSVQCRLFRAKNIHV
mmetsp:Transcript_30756/g.62345  ORF Transcript_30756/g.62345 Transcript_30756/m.62345 type:complete len:228 (+) Transcript_30756:1191-1874(+)